MQRRIFGIENEYGVTCTLRGQRRLSPAVSALAGPDRTLTAESLEAAVLDRGNDRRAFRRLNDDEITTILEG